MKALIKVLLLLIAISPFSCYAEDFYWVGGEGKWSDEDHWAKSSGSNILHNRVPTLQDNVIFDEKSFTEDDQAVLIDILNADVKDADFSNVAYPFFLRVIAGGRNLSVYGSFAANSKFNSELSDLIFEAGNADVTIETAGRRLASTVIFNSSRKVDLITDNRSLATYLHFNGKGSLHLHDTLRASVSIEISNGALVTNNHTILSSSVSISGSNTRVQLMGSDIYTSQWSLAGVNTFSSGSSTIKVSENWGGNFNGGGYAYYNVELCGKITINGQNSYNTLTFCEASDIELQAGVLQTTKNLVARGTPATPIRIASTIFEQEAFIRQSGEVINGSSLNLEDIHASGGASFNASESVDLGNVQGWNITQPQSQKFFWVGGTGNWSDYQNHWAKSSGGSDFHNALPNVYDEVIFDRNSFDGIGEVVVDLYHIYAGRMDWTDIDQPITMRNFDFGNQDYIYSKLHVFGSLMFSELASSSLSYIRFKSDKDEVVDGARSFLAGTMVFYHTAKYSIMAHNAEIAHDIFLNKEGITIIEDSVIIGGNLNLNLGSLIVDSSYINCPRIRLTGNLVDITKSSIETTSWNIHDISEFESDSSLIKITNGSFWGGSLNYFDVILCQMVTIDGENSYNKLEFCPGSDIYLPSGFTQNADTLAITGEPGFPVSISATQEGSMAGLSQNGGTVEVQYMYLMDNEASGADFTALESIDLGNVSGWNVFNPDPQKFYWVNGEGNWSEYESHWAKTSGGSDFHDRIPGALDEVIIDDNSFQVDYQNLVIDQIKSYVRAIDFSEANQQYHINGGRQFWCFGDFIFSELGSSGLPLIKFPVDSSDYNLNSGGQYIASNLWFNHEGSYGCWLLKRHY